MLTFWSAQCGDAFMLNFHTVLSPCSSSVSASKFNIKLFTHLLIYLAAEKSNMLLELVYLLFDP